MTLASRVLMIEPEHFAPNPEIAADNFFLKDISVSLEELRRKAKSEFNGLKTKLEDVGIEVFAFNPTYSSPAPDAVFPNNWFSTHPSGNIFFYPMMSPMRRVERHSVIVNFLDYQYPTGHDLSSFEERNLFLEGTGSMVIEHRNKIAFASESPRTSEYIFNYWCDLMKHEPVFFHATDERGKAIYHTNVILTIAENFAIVCTESIRDEKEREMVTKKLSGCGLGLVEISFEQAKKFSGNALALQNKKGEQVFVISEQGWNALSGSQKSFIENHCAGIITSPLDTIEACGGGSARCMLAELF